MRVQDVLADAALVSDVRWFDAIGSTNAEVARHARAGAAEGLLVLADEQTAGRGRRGRVWHAPPGTSLMGSLLLRPDVEPSARTLVPLLVGVALCEAAEAVAPDVDARLKWPNDLLIDGRKSAGILVEVHPPDAVVVGTGVNVDWRGVARPPDLAGATSLAEAAGHDIDRWALLAAYLDRLAARYAAWQREPPAFLDDYRRRCTTIGRTVVVTHVDGTVLRGVATDVDVDGSLRVDGDHRDGSGRGAGGALVVRAGDVTHVRPG